MIIVILILVQTIATQTLTIQIIVRIIVRYMIMIVVLIKRIIINFYTSYIRLNTVKKNILKQKMTKYNLSEQKKRTLIILIL